MKRAIASVTTLAFLLAACGGGNGADTSPSPAAPSPTPSGTVYTQPARVGLTATDVRLIIAQAAAEATARGKPATIAVVDRVGNVLALYRMTGAGALMHVADAPNGQNFDAQGLTVPSEFGAISKAVTGAYLSSGGNAFSSRTASMITQQHFPPAPVAAGLESGPLYGVQFSQLPCSDFNTRFGSGAPQIGPKRTPLGLSADPGGFPLYKGGTLVGGIGVMADGEYGFDPDVLDVDVDDDEAIALAGTFNFEAPGDILASRITIDGTSLRYSDATRETLRRDPATAPAFTSISGALLAQSSFAAAVVSDGAVLGTEASGVRAATASEFSNPDAFVFSNGAGTNRFPIRAGTDGLITAVEARTILEEAFTIMSRARGQIRRPLDSRAQVTISLVDTSGAVLGIVRAPDAPLFGADVSLQKARTAAFFSSSTAGTVLDNDPSPDVRNFANKARAFIGSAAFTGQFAFSDRANGNLHRPYFPDGQINRSEGPFSRPIAQFNPLSTGLQSAYILSGLRAQLLSNSLPFCSSSARTGNGIQIFPGSVPIYRGETLVGAIGVSGDGIDQDDMISFLGTSNGGQKLNTGIGNAPPARRADQLVFALPNSSGIRLRYISCPFAPFLDTNEQNVCQGR